MIDIYNTLMWPFLIDFNFNPNVSLNPQTIEKLRDWVIAIFILLLIVRGFFLIFKEREKITELLIEFISFKEGNRSDKV